MSLTGPSAPGDPLVPQHHATTVENGMRRDHTVQPLVSKPYGGYSDHAYTPLKSGAGHEADKEMRTTDLEVRSVASHTSLSPLSSTLYTLWVDGWTTEILSCGFAVIALICLIIILVHFDGFVLTNMPLKISINTLVAVFAAMIKALLLLSVAEAISQLKWIWFSQRKPLIDFESFDLASRGPWGSFLLVLRLQSRHFAALGAWITILALAIDPFTQQIIHPISCHRVVPESTALVARANNFTSSSSSVGPGLTPVLLPNASAAILVGLLSNTGKIDFECSTGNCTFPIEPATGASFQSLGLETSCVDVSAEARELGNATWYIPRLGNSSNSIGSATLARTVSNLSSLYFPEYWPTQNITSLFSFAVLMLDVDWGCYALATNASSRAACLKPLAVECRVWPTLQTISARIELSELKEKVLASQPLDYISYFGYLYSGWLHVSSKVLRNGTWNLCTGSANYSATAPVPVSGTGLWYNGFSEVPKDLQWYPEDCVWTVSSGTSTALSGYLQELFHDKVMTGAYGVTATTSSYGELWIKSLYRNGTASISTVESYAGQLADSITVYARNWNALRNTAKWGFANGDAIKTETCIQVRWAWVCFPVALVVLTVVFLATTAWKTRKSHGPGAHGGNWKSSSLAVLFGGLDEGVRQNCGSMGKKTEMLICASDLKVSLAHTEEGWRLTTHHDLR